ncbi:hypothetical protein Tco_1379435 [Tanacetum coccineum]
MIGTRWQYEVLFITSGGYEVSRDFSAVTSGSGANRARDVSKTLIQGGVMRDVSTKVVRDGDLRHNEAVVRAKRL